MEALLDLLFYFCKLVQLETIIYVIFFITYNSIFMNVFRFLFS